MSNSITQNDYDSVDISSSISVFFKRFHVASILKSSNVRKIRNLSSKDSGVHVHFDIQRKIHVHGSSDESIRSCSL